VSCSIKADPVGFIGVTRLVRPGGVIAFMKLHVRNSFGPFPWFNSGSQVDGTTGSTKCLPHGCHITTPEIGDPNFRTHGLLLPLFCEIPVGAGCGFTFLRWITTLLPQPYAENRPDGNRASALSGPLDDSGGPAREMQQLSVQSDSCRVQVCRMDENLIAASSSGEPPRTGRSPDRML